MVVFDGFNCKLLLSKFNLVSFITQISNEDIKTMPRVFLVLLNFSAALRSP